MTTIANVDAKLLTKEKLPEKIELSSFSNFKFLMGFEDVWKLEMKYSA